MHRVVIDATVLVSAFLKAQSGGVSFDLLRSCAEGRFELFLSDDIIAETADVLLSRPHIRRRYQYPDAAVHEFCRGLAALATRVSDVPKVKVVRDPDDDMVIACALAARADYLVTRDKDLLTLAAHADVAIATPEAFSAVLRSEG
jgi:uncharacterized protein